jgi:predicted amidohydrolase YtcJ
MTADLILKNLHAITFSGQEAAAELIAIKGNKILYVGAADALGYLKGPHTRVLDCGGGLVVPGFNDTHCHPLAFAITRRHADCSKARCIADIQKTLREKARETKSGQWVRGANCDFSALAEGRAPNRTELDAAAPDIPALLLERSGQHCVLNSRALELCGITADTPDPASSRIRRDPDTGLPDGMISGNNELVAKAVPPPTEQEIEAGMRQANQEYLSLGITSLQDTSWSNGYRHWQALKSFKNRGVLSPRLTLLPGVGALEEFAELGLKTGGGDSQMRVGAVKIALDESTGNPSPPQEDINAAALRAHLAGFQLAFHVSDVYLLQASMQSLEFVRGNAPSPCIRPRFEHCPVCPPGLVPELAASGAIVVTQPNLLFETGPLYLDQVSSDQLTWVYPLNSFARHGITLALSSDSPLTPCDPFRAIHTAVTRTVAGGGTLSPDEGVSVLEALKMYTYSGAYSSLEEKSKGSIAVGMLADLAVINGDLTHMSPEELVGARVMATVIDGKVVWER